MKRLRRAQEVGGCGRTWRAIGRDEGQTGCRGRGRGSGVGR
ncbi:hypothetical protein chiPu_0030423, partial [Chiloscyllium punctatum]|nr:hypothetical protein [Chiloscyllium punctatum]